MILFLLVAVIVQLPHTLPDNITVPLLINALQSFIVIGVVTLYVPDATT
jgi:hypothetical protein